MILPKHIVNWLEKQCGRKMMRSADCEFLALDIESVTREHIGVNTIKRLLGFINDERNARITTLDIIARYLGCETWEHLLELDREYSGSSFEQRRDEVIVRRLKPGRRIRIYYPPNREVTIEYQGDSRFFVVESKNSKLLPGDLLTINNIIERYPLLVNDVIRDGQSLGSFSTGQYTIHYRYLINPNGNEMSDYLMEWREEMPQWLADYQPGDYVPFYVFMDGRVGYYPGAEFDGCLIETANKAHCVHAFLHVDYGLTCEQVKQKLSADEAISGYHSIGRVNWYQEEVYPNGQTPPQQLSERFNDSGKFALKDEPPYCFMEIFERDVEKDDSWGAERFALTYLFADGIMAYYQLFVKEYKKAPWIFLLQDHGFGGNYDRFGNGGLLHDIILRYGTMPEFVIGDIHSNSMWDGYHRILEARPVIGGMHHNERALYAKDDH